MFLSAFTASAQNLTTNNNPTVNITTNTVYEIYPTLQPFMYIKLNTSNGEMSMIEINPDDFDERTETELHQKPLCTDGREPQNGRFGLIITTNPNSLLLLDKIDGRVWQVYFYNNHYNTAYLFLIEP